MRSTGTRRARLIAMGLAALSVSLGGLACGDSDDDGDANANANAKKSTARNITWGEALGMTVDDDKKASPGVGTDKGRITETLGDVQVSLAAGFGDSVCNELTETGWRELAVMKPGRGDYQSCKDLVAKVSHHRREQKFKTALSEVLSVKLADGWAVAHIRDPDGTRRAVPFVKEPGGSWRVTSMLLVDSNDVEPPPEGPGHDLSDPMAGGDRGAIEEVVYDIQGDFPRGHGNGVCHELTAAGQREIEQSGVRIGTCEEIVPVLTERMILRGFQPRQSKVLDVRIDGRKATVLLDDLGVKGKPYRVAMRKEAEGWKAVSVTDYEPVDFDSLTQ